MNKQIVREWSTFKGYTSEHLEQLLVEAAGLMVNDEDRFALVVVDSIMGGFRVDYSGRGELADRQQKLGRVLNKLQKISEARGEWF